MADPKVVEITDDMEAAYQEYLNSIDWVGDVPPPAGPEEGFN